MKKILAFTILATFLTSTINATIIHKDSCTICPLATKYDIKIKNDSGDEVTVYNGGSGGSYRLTKNATTTIKMEAGDKLYVYNNGKKGRLLLTAAADMHGKVQLFSKL